jgi:peptidoglycan/LPS O-acetylase OafA/YrhL
LSTRAYFLNFYGRRSLRIFPLYYTYLAVLGVGGAIAIATGLAPATVRIAGQQYVYAVTYTYDFFHASSEFIHSWLLTHFWSLAVEEQFYLVWPLVILYVNEQRLKHLLLLIIVAGPLIRIGEVALATGPMATLFHHRLELVIYVLPFSHIDAFAVGGYMALFGRTPRRSLVATYLVALIAVGLITERLATGTTGTGMSLGYGEFMHDSWKYVWGYSCFNVLFGCFLLLLRDRQMAPSIMEHPVLVYLGRISYGLYVYHFAIIFALSLTKVERLYNAPIAWRVISAIAMLSVTILVSVVSYELLEAPFLRMKDRFFPTGVVRPMSQVA